ncbi:MAG: glycosyltransferase [Nitrospiria bacterium]
MKLKENKKKVLIVSYHFPPDAEVGGIRPAKFAKYLPEFGWHPYVLTIKEKYIKTKDVDRLKDVEGVEIIRTSEWPNILEILLGLRDIVYKRFGIRQGKNPSSTSGDYLATKKNGSSRRIPFLKRVLNSIFELPDKNVGWLIPAVWKGYWLIKKECIPVVFATSPPPTSGVVGFILAKLTRAKLITDLRDPWFLHEAKAPASRTSLSDSIERWLEKKITGESHKVISTTEHYTEFLKSRYSWLPENHFGTIFNGFDRADFGGNGRPDDPGNLFVVTYLGTFYYGRTPKEFLKAVGELVGEEIIPRASLEINFIGDVRQVEGVPVEELIKMNSLEGSVILTDKIPYRESLAQMKRAVVLLLFAPEQYYAIPGKAFEYLCAGRNILCFAREGATADLIRQTKSGVVVDPYDVAAIKSAMKDLYLFWKKGTNLNHQFDIRCFERRELTRQLSQLFNE